MERFQAKLIPIATTSSTSTPVSELTLPILNDDVIWMILNYLKLADLLMVHAGWPKWRHVTRKLLFKQKMAWFGYDADYYNRMYNGMIFRRSLDRSLPCRAFIPKEWLENNNLTQWKWLLEFCPNLSRLHLENMEQLDVGQIIKILELIPRLCKNLKSFYFHYEPAIRWDLSCEDVVKIDMSKDELMFPWIPSWGHVDEKEIILTPKLLEPKFMGNNYALDYVKGILAKVKPYIRDPYWFSMTFQRRQLRHLATNARTVVARLQTLTLGTCSVKMSRSNILYQLRMLRTPTYAETVQSEKIGVKEEIAEYIEDICLLLKQLTELEELSRALFSLEHFKNTENVSVTSEIKHNWNGCHCRKASSGCRCCSCWMCYPFPPYICIKCGYCSSQLAWTDWNTHWKTGHKSDWNVDWSKYGNWDDRNSGRCESADWKQESRNETTSDKRRGRKTNNSDDGNCDRRERDKRKSTRHERSGNGDRKN